MKQLREVRPLKAFAFGIILAALIVFAAPRALGTTEHCPDHEGHPGKVQSVVDGDLDSVVLDEGTSFCVKSSTEATGLLVADGESTLCDYLKEAGIVGGDEECSNVSYYVVYQAPEPTPTPTVTPTPPVPPTPEEVVPTPAGPEGFGGGEPLPRTGDGVPYLWLAALAVSLIAGGFALRSFGNPYARIRRQDRKWHK